ncbi:MAG TPA: DUF58 domain-containing protein [Prolixibacteraceae bacterium]|nr:DUF58 domain-containing protein [Prolixibacteraceae bacterium]
MNNLPDIQQLQQFDNLEFISKEIVEGFITGLHRSPFHGFSVEFAEHRLYNTGESTKHLDWKLYARTDRLFVKQYEEETNLRCQLVIDTSSSMLFPYEKGKPSKINKLAFSVYSAAAIIYLLRKQRDAVGLSLFSNEVEFHSQARLSSVHIDLLYNQLANLLLQEQVHVHKKTNTVDALHMIAENIHKRSLVILFSDLIEQESTDELFEALQHLKYNKHEVLLYHVTDHRQEREFDFRNQPYRFVDLETGDHIKFLPHDLKPNYQKAISEYFEEMRVRCGQYHIDLAEANINEDFKHVLYTYLLKRKRLF